MTTPLRIQVNVRACGNPLKCRRCLLRCPQNVFGAYPREPYPGARKKEWIVLPILTSQCNGCKLCLRFCPQHAITLQESNP